MNVKKIQLEAIFNTLKGTEGMLNFADSRVRDSILKPLADQLNTYYDNREAIYKSFCKKNENGEPDLLDGNRYQFEPSQLDEINKELLTLAEETVDMYVTDDVSKFREIMEKSEYKPKVGEVERIDEVLK